MCLGRGMGMWKGGCPLLASKVRLSSPMPITGLIHSLPDRHDLPSTPEPFHLTSLLSLIPFFSPLLPPLSSDSHLLGQHTIHMSPISTAHLNPHAHTFCLSPHTGNTVLIPILLNNTEVVANVRYTITPLGYVDGQGKIEYVELGQ